jgi:hypothetical protein
VSAAAIGARELQYADVRYDRFHLPAFDGHIYVAMAEDPRFFTVAPWGYRVLLPWLIAALRLPHPAGAFFWTTSLGLTAAGVLLFLYLRRLGNRVPVALLGVALYGASEPVGEAVRYQFLVEPLTLALELALLLALAAGAELPWLALLLVLGTLSKEFFLLLVPLVYLARRERVGRLPALLQTVLAAAPALAAASLLRLFWTPYLSLAPVSPDLRATVALALGRLSDTWRDWWSATLLLGLTPLAAAGALRERARPLRLGATYLLVATLVSPFLNPVAFFAADVRRLLIYALPAVLALALVALDRGTPDAVRAPPLGTGAGWRHAALAATLILAAAPTLVVDRYRRFDLRGTSDALRAFAVFRETLRTSREIEQGEAFRFDPTSGRFSQGVGDDRTLVELRRMRWFLGDGWGERAPREEGAPTVVGRSASLIVPSLHPNDLAADLALSAPAGSSILFSINGFSLAAVDSPGGSVTQRLQIPARLLFRGDNMLVLAVAGEAKEKVALRGFTLARPRAPLER